MTMATRSPGFGRTSPSNTLAALYGLGEDCRARQVLGPDVDIVIHPIDETNTRVRPDRLMAEIERSGGKGLICLVGVQTNQYPHAVDLARKFLKGSLPGGDRRLPRVPAACRCCR